MCRAPITGSAAVERSTVTKKTLTTDRLLRAGFALVGEWELSDSGELHHRIELPDLAGVYAFAIDGIVRYVGVAARSMRQRFKFYTKPGRTQRTSLRLNEKMRVLKSEGAMIQVLVAHPVDGTWNGLKISGPEGLEAGLIQDFDLPWNIRGSARSSAVLQPEVIEGEASGMSFYVYENTVRDKAIVHRGNCSFCNEGAGLHGSRTTKSSTWHGPYASAHEAMVKAKACRRTRTEGCAVCSPL